MRGKGAYVDLTGPDFTQNSSGGVHLVIVEDFDRKPSCTVSDTSV
jgi:hypothetical protein